MIAIALAKRNLKIVLSESHGRYNHIRLGGELYSIRKQVFARF